MPKAKKAKRAAPLSSELGEGNFGIDFNAKGRAIRKCRKQPRDSPFEDSAIAISDPEDDDLEEADADDVIAVMAPSRKRKRSPSPELPLASDEIAALSDSDSEPDVAPSPSPAATGSTTIHLTVNIPAGQQGPITLHIDPRQFASVASTPTSRPDKLTQSMLVRLNARSKPMKKKRAGFLDLPAELRNEIYRQIFVSEKSVNFAVPNNFSRSSALLRTCHQVHEEGRSILYSENTFTIERRTQRYGSLWEHEWKELGYMNVRKFMKSIGPTNTALIRNLAMMLEDAVPCLNPNMRTNEERRFVHDDDLMSVLRHLGNHSQLKTLKVHFHGRRRVERTDDRFLDYMKRLKTDSIKFVDWPPSSTYPRASKQDSSVEQMLLKSCTRKKKKFD